MSRRVAAMVENLNCLLPNKMTPYWTDCMEELSLIFLSDQATLLLAMLVV